MYRQIIDELNAFLNSINVSGTPLNPDVFQGVFVKKLSNQNIVKDKRRINAGETISTVNQTHIDVTGRQSMLFFFEELNDTTTASQNIDIDLYSNNLKYLNENDNRVRKIDQAGNTYFKRNAIITPRLTDLDNTLHSSAYKKYGHAGEQVQINIPDAEESFTQLQKYAFQDDALIMLKYDYLHYFAVLIPYELCDNLYSITSTYGTHNVNFVAANPTYNFELAHDIQYEIISSDVTHDEIDAEILHNMLLQNPQSGTDVEKFVKTRISQGSFRRLLLLEHHQCNLCNITTTTVLRASHIKEWSTSSREERIDPNNGLLLCANHDALFDRHQISFDPESGEIHISASIDDEQKAALNLSDSFNLSMSDRMKAYMQIHHNKFIDKENN